MPTRRLIVLLLAVLAPAALAACGGNGSGSSREDVNRLLSDTFSSGHQVTSGKLDLTLRVTSPGAAGGGFNAHLAGPFVSQGAGKLPKFAMAATLSGGGESIKAGATSTGDKAFVVFQGTSYALSAREFEQFRAGYEQAQRKAGGGKSASPTALGIDPRRWLKNARTAGEVNDAVRITGSVDVPRLLDDLNTALGRARALGLQGNQPLPQPLSEAEKRRAAQEMRNVRVDIFTGKDDHVFRGMTVNLDAVQANRVARVLLDYRLADVNRGQTIGAPANPKPFSELTRQLQALQGLLGTSSSSGSASGSAGTANLEKYTRCVQDAGSDAAKARRCADLLTP